MPSSRNHVGPVTGITHFTWTVLVLFHPPPPPPSLCVCLSRYTQASCDRYNNEVARARALLIDETL